MISQSGNTYYGLSTDSKPSGTALNGREFREMDTGKTYAYDAENDQWIEQPSEGGGGGGGSGGGVLNVSYTVEDTGPDEYVVTSCSHTASEIYEHMVKGGMAYAWVYDGVDNPPVGQPMYVIPCTWYEKDGDYIGINYEGGAKTALIGSDTAIELVSPAVEHTYDLEGGSEDTYVDTQEFYELRLRVQLANSSEQG